MAQVRRKTAYADYKSYFRRAREQGVALSWDRYEGMLPQDGFARLGLACFDCLMGPCRISPFSREEERTVCGFMGDELMYRTVMRMMGATPGGGDALKSVVAAARELAAGEPPCGEGKVRVGFGALDPDRVNICVEGACPARLAALSADGVKVSAVGRLVPGYDTAASYGDAELLLLTGLVDAYIAAGGVTRVLGAARGCHTELLRAGDDAACVARARRACALRSGAGPLPDRSVTEVDVLSMETALRAAGGGRFAVIGGGSSVKLTQDGLALELVKAFSGRGIPVVVCGGAAASLAKYGLYGAGVLCCGDSAASLLRCADAVERKPPVLMPEIATGRGMAAAIAVAAAGFEVLTATELPMERLGGLVRTVGPDGYVEEALRITEGEAVCV